MEMPRNNVVTAPIMITRIGDISSVSPVGVGVLIGMLFANITGSPTAITPSGSMLFKSWLFLIASFTLDVVTREAILFEFVTVVAMGSSITGIDITNSTMTPDAKRRRLDASSYSTILLIVTDSLLTPALLAIILIMRLITDVNVSDSIASGIVTSI
jgi:hypothetical protein